MKLDTSSCRNPSVQKPKYLEYVFFEEAMYDIQWNISGSKGYEGLAWDYWWHIVSDQCFLCNYCIMSHDENGASEIFAGLL